MVVFDDDYIFHHGIKGQRWGVRRYQNSDGTLTDLGKVRYSVQSKANEVMATMTNKPKTFIEKPIDKLTVSKRGNLNELETDTCVKLADSLYKNAKMHEPKITDDVISAVTNANGHMYSLENRLKQPTSLAAKIGADSKSDRISMNDAAKGINDSIRYTAILDDSNFFNSYNVIKQRLSDSGYFEAKCKNYFTKFENGEVEHKAVQSVFRSQSGQTFELQFQTPESQAAKELKIPLYEEVRNKGVSETRKHEIVKQMHDLASCVNNPKNIFDIPSHSDELRHHGIKGQHWGVRNGPPYPLGGSGNTLSNGNAIQLKDYKGSAYFISEQKFEDLHLEPRIPRNFMTKNGYEDSETPRISFAPSVDQCLAGLSQNVEDKTFYVYEPVDISKCDVYKPNTKAVPDSEITNELWVVNPIEIKQTRKIKITGNRGEDGKTYSYGDQKAMLFDDWTYEDTD